MVGRICTLLTFFCALKVSDNLIEKSLISVSFDHRTTSCFYHLYPMLLFIVCCTAFSIHVCLFTRDVILLGIESAPLLEDELPLQHSDLGCQMPPKWQEKF